MEIKVFSRPAIEALPPPKVPYIVISITNTSEEDADVPQGSHCLGVLRLSFDDIPRPLPDLPQFHAFTPEQADAVWSFIEERPTAQECLIHCNRGKHRSPAIAAALSEVLNGSHALFFKRYSPLMLVYKTLMDRVPEDLK